MGFNLQIMFTYEVAGHWEGTINRMSSFKVKIILRKDIVTYNIFSNKNKDILDLLTLKYPQFGHLHLPKGDIVTTRATEQLSFEI